MVLCHFADKRARMSEGNREDIAKQVVWGMVGAVVLIVVLMGLYHSVLSGVIPGTQEQATFADSFGPVGIVISGASLFGLLLTIFLQIKATDHAAASQKRANDIACLNSRLELLKEQMAFNRAVFENCPDKRTAANKRIKDLLGEMAREIEQFETAQNG